MKIQACVFPGKTYNIIVRKGSSVKSLLKILGILNNNHEIMYNGMFVDDKFCMNNDLEFNIIFIIYVCYKTEPNDKLHAEELELMRWEDI